MTTRPTTSWRRWLRGAAVTAAAAVGLSGCGFSPYDLPLPGGADVGEKPYEVTAEFRDVLDLVPQSGVRFNDLPVGKVTDIRLNGWTAKVTLQVNGDVKLPDNAVATIRQTSLLGEKFVSLAPPPTGATGQLSQGDNIPLDRSGRNPEIEEVFSAASLLLNGGGLERTNTIVKELNATLSGNEPEIRELLGTTEQFLGQLDDNKEQLLTSLEKVNRLAITANEQRDAITGALDDLPDALRVVNDQRDDLVELLQSLNRLGDVATGVIRQSKADTVADLKLLVPTLRNLATASDDLAYDFKALLTYPFVDGAVGGSVAKVTGRCDPDVDDPDSTGFCVGDYSNLNLGLTLEAGQLGRLLGGATAGAEQDETAAAQSEGDADASGGAADATEQLNDTLDSLLGGGSTPAPRSSGSATPRSQGGSDTDGSGGGVLCGLLNQCRAQPASTDRDFSTVLLEPVRAR